MIVVLPQPFFGAFDSYQKGPAQRVILWAISVSASGSDTYGTVLYADGTLETVPLSQIVVENAQLSFDVLDYSTEQAKKAWAK